MYFAATPALRWVRGYLGTPRWFGDDLGLAAPAWLENRSLPHPPDADEEPLDSDEMAVVINDTMVGNRSAEEILSVPGGFATMQDS